MNLSNFEIVQTSMGVTSIRDLRTKEIMHNPVGPWQESSDLYVRQSQLLSKLNASKSTDPLVLFDVGLGSGFNTIAAITAKLSLGEDSRPLKIISFEHDLTLFQFTIDHIEHFPFMIPHKQMMVDVLNTRIWQSSDGSIEWIIREGEFPDQIDLESNLADLIYYDPYSPAVNPEMWTPSTFKKLFQKCKPQSKGFTYSVATGIRSAMLAADFYVGHGNKTGLKEETTEFSSDMNQLTSPFGQEWFGRWVRSHTKFSNLLSSEERAKLEDKVLEHPQISPWLHLKDTELKRSFPKRRSKHKAASPT